MPFEKELDELEKKRTRALEMGGAEKIKKQHDGGKLTARERIDRLLDPDSFLEVGMFNHSDVPGMEEKDFATQAKHAEMIKECDRYVVF